MDKDLFMLVWKAVGPEITKYHTYRLEDFVKYDQHNNTNRLSYGLQLFNRCSDRYYAWSIACKYNCERLVKYLQENPIDSSKIIYHDLLSNIAKNGRVEYIDLVDGFHEYILRLNWNPRISDDRYHPNYLKWIINNTNISVTGLRLLADISLSYKDIILLYSRRINIDMTPNNIYTLRTNIGDFDNLYAAYLCALNGDNIKTILDYRHPQFGTDLLFIKAMVDRRSVDDLKTLFSDCKKNNIAIKKNIFLRYALFDGHLDTIKFLLGTKTKVLIPKKGYARTGRSFISYELNAKNYELDAIKFLLERCRHVLPWWCISEFLKHSRYDILEFYYTKEPIATFDDLIKHKISVYALRDLPRDAIQWLRSKNFISDSKYLQIIIESPSFTAEDLVAYYKEHKTKAVIKSALEVLFIDPQKFKAVYNYFGTKKMGAAIKKFNTWIFSDISIDILLLIDSESYQHLADIFMECYPNIIIHRNPTICEQYILDHL